MKFVAGPVALVVLALGASVAHAQDATATTTTTTASPDADLASIREMILYARYTTAEPAIATYLGRADLDATQRNAGLEARAILQIARRHLPEARATLAELYARDPEHTIRDPDAGPDVRSEFDRARAAHSAPVTVTMEDRTPDALTERVSPTIDVHVGQGANAVNELRLWYRNGTSGAFQQTIMTLDPLLGSATARLPVADGTAEYVAQYYADATAPSGAALGRLGSREAPLTVSVPRAAAITSRVDPHSVFDEPQPVAQQGGSVVDEWWFWTIIGVVVVGGGVGAYFGITAATAGTNMPPGTLGGGGL